jgi:hypothetical protein
MYTLDEVLAKEEAIKFVRINDEYRFCGIDDCHSDLVHPGEQAQSAGLFLLWGPNKMRLTENESDTLHIGPSADDGQRLSELLGKNLV